MRQLSKNQIKNKQKQKKNTKKQKKQNIYIYYLTVNITFPVTTSLPNVKA